MLGKLSPPLGGGTIPPPSRKPEKETLCTELNPSLISGVEGLSIQGGMGGGPNQEVVPPIKGCPLPAPLLKIFFKKSLLFILIYREYYLD